MKARKIRIGIIGLGRIAPQHFDVAIRGNNEFELVAVCDIQQDKLERIASEQQVTAYSDYQQLINDPNVDVVTICTPNHLHLPMAKEVAAAGKHCILEKPVTQTLQETTELIELFHSAHCMLFPVLQVRFSPTVKTLKDLMDTRGLGTLVSAAMVIRWTRPQKYYDESKWRGSHALDGGSLLSQAIHYLDIMQYVLGKPRDIYASIKTMTLDIETEDTAHALFEYESGLAVTFEFTVATYPHNLECSLTLIG
ncbi:Gfo/Idh/MocA family oxidoreductase, partial [Candidatus Peribacteria bacterium]|nr:Gfo/Idh/MocA family oxidoreductase [Candidatus Peribacteria bacterium]